MSVEASLEEAVAVDRHGQAKKTDATCTIEE